MTPTEALLVEWLRACRYVDEDSGLSDELLAEDARKFFASMSDHGWRLCGTDDVTVTVDGLAMALECLPWLERQVWRGEYDAAAAAILAVLSADKEEGR